MNKNHRLVDQMMVYCGFAEGAVGEQPLHSGRPAERALGAKLTGAGGGGSVFALVSPGAEYRLAQLWQQTSAGAGLLPCPHLPAAGQPAWSDRRPSGGV